MSDVKNSQVEIEKERQRIAKVEQTLMTMKMFLFDYFHRLGPDPEENIDIIVETTCKVLGSTVALYNRLEGDVLKTWSIYNEPPDFKREDSPNGHICYDMTIKERSPDNLSHVVLEDLEGSKWEELDANVKNYGIKSYLGFPVMLENEVVGSLCIVDTEKRTYSEIEKNILEAFSKAVNLEEERKLSQDRLTRSNEELVEKNLEVEKALLEVKTLSGMLPICASCKMIRDDKGYWNQIEAYIQEHSEAQFTHSICQQCATKLYPELYDEKGELKLFNDSEET